MRLRNKTLLASILFITISFVSMAQETPPPPMPPPPPGLPIDGYIPVVLILAILYGLKKSLKASINKPL